MTTETIAPAMVRFPMPVYHAGRLVFGLAGAAVTMAIVILAFHAAPVHKKIFTVIDYKTKPPFGLGLDHLWLGFFQYETGAVFSNMGYGGRDPYRTYGHGGRVNVFDPKAEWLLVHYDARPYGTGSVTGRRRGLGRRDGGRGWWRGWAAATAATRRRRRRAWQATRRTRRRPAAMSAGACRSRYGLAAPEPAYDRSCTISNFGRPDLPDVSWIWRR